MRPDLIEFDFREFQSQLEGDWAPADVYGGTRRSWSGHFVMITQFNSYLLSSVAFVPIYSIWIGIPFFRIQLLFARLRSGNRRADKPDGRKPLRYLDPNFDQGKVCSSLRQTIGVRS